MTETAFALRPLRLVELLDAAFRLYRRNFWTLVGIMALVQIPIMLLSIGASVFSLQGMEDLLNNQFSVQYFLGLGSSLIISIISIFLTGFASVAVIRSISSSYLGEKLGVMDSYRQAGHVLGKAILTMFLCGLLGLAFFVWFLVPCVGWVSGFGLYLYFVSVISPLAIIVVTLENRSASESIQRAWALSRRRFWWLLGLAGALSLLSLILTGPSILLNAVLQSAAQSSGDTANLISQTAINTIIQTVISMLVGLLYAPLQLCVMALAYFDVRIRTEGFDLSLAAMNTDGEPITVESIAKAPAVQSPASIVTGTEIGYFVVITLAGLLLFGLLYGALIGIVLGVMGFSSGF